ncbi:MAG: capsule biosynthesis GfcC family protein, partial [Syntrophobacteraceae bacterium]|nr:capsule biosynthesis GfcC family protein [Syntrophobacteraceae bacterium]
ASAEGGSGLDRSEVAGLELYQRQKKLFVDSLKYIEAKGRMVVQIDEPSRMKNTLFDLELEEGDTLYVPSNPQVIQVVGAVMNQSGFTYEPGKDHGYYVARAGGMTRTADKSKVFIMKVDGTAVQPGKGFFWDSSSRRWASGAAGVLEPGDIVVVPQRLDKTAWLKETRDLVQILYQIAVGAGVLLRL